MSLTESPFVISEIKNSILSNKKIAIDVLRDDLFHPIIPLKNNLETALNGNKWRKLKYNIERLKKEKKKGIVSFGGAFSNHLYALAAAGNLFDFKTIAILRGEIIKPYNPTLSFCIENNMNLISWNRTDYKLKENISTIEKLEQIYKDYLIVPEGGTNELALKGVSEIWKNIEKTYDYICVAIGTSGTFGGIILGSENKSTILGFPVLKMDFEATIKSHLSNHNYSFNNWKLINDFHFGGYAKTKKELIDFINEFYKNHTIKLDPIYNGKLFYGVFDMIENNKFEANSKILIIHTGGLQGIEGFKERFGADVLKF